MLIIPAVDIKGGVVVRLVQGKDNLKVYSRDPLKAARHWARQGAQFLHVVDLDAAMGISYDNSKLIKMIPKAVDIPVEIGGGIRTEGDIRKMLAAGFSRVVLGTKAVEDAGFLKKAYKKFGDKVIVSIDAKEDKIMTKGWRMAHSQGSVLDFIRVLKKIGFRQIIYTDTLKDGTLKGPNTKAVKNLLKTGIKIIASGGVSSLEDIRKLKMLTKHGLTGIIIGKAIYEGKFTLTQALKAA